METGLAGVDGATHWEDRLMEFCDEEPRTCDGWR
jgi:hypothetical protein